MSVKNMSNYLCISTSNDTGLINKACIIPDVEKLTFPVWQYRIYTLIVTGIPSYIRKCYLDLTLDLDYI